MSQISNGMRGVIYFRLDNSSEIELLLILDYKGLMFEVKKVTQAFKKANGFL